MEAAGILLRRGLRRAPRADRLQECVSLELRSYRIILKMTKQLHRVLSQQGDSDHRRARTPVVLPGRTRRKKPKLSALAAFNYEFSLLPSDWAVRRSPLVTHG
jgi:hypothetical protein